MKETKFKKTKIILFTLVLLFPTFVLAKREVSVSCSDNIILNKETTCTMNINVESNEALVGASFDIDISGATLNSTNSEYNLHSNNNSYIIFSDTEIKNLMTFKVTPTKNNANISFKNIEISLDNQTDEDDLQTVENYQYDFKVDNSSNNDTNLNLKNLKISNINLNPEFNSNIYEYTATTDLDTITISAEAYDSNVAISGTGKHELKVGVNEIDIKVSDSNNNENVYTLKITRNSSKEQSGISNPKTGVYSIFSIIIITLLICLCIFKNKKKLNLFKKF